MTRPRSTTRVVLLLASVAVLAVAGCSGSDDRADAGAGGSAAAGEATVTSVAESTTSTAPTTTVAPDSCDAPAAAGAPPAGSYAVGRQFRTYVDPSRGTQADEGRGVPAEPERTLPVTVLYPAVGAPSEPGAFAQDAAPAAGDFPLVVYSHGVLSSGTDRNDTLARWASAGYVVVAPTYPRSSGAGGLVADLPHQAVDVLFVVDTFAAQVAESADPLHDAVATGCLAVAGHSLGGATTLAAAYDPCCTRLGPRAVVDIAGVLFPATPGAQLADAAPLPTLIVHGREDPLVKYDQGERAFAELTGPRWFVSFSSGDHNSMFLPPESAVLDTAVLAFLDAELKGDRAALAALPVTAEQWSDATLAVAP
jgi:dienelactone hydrolase